MTTGVLVAVRGPREAELVQLADARGTGLRVVRRCADLAEVLAAAVAGLGAVAVVSGDLEGMDRTAVARLGAAGVRTVLLAPPEDVERCRALGAHAVLDAGTPVADWLTTVQAAAASEAGADGGPVPTARRAPRAVAGADGAAPAGDASGDAPPDGEASPDADGAPGGPAPRIVAVWGPRGAPGRTTVAVALAAELAAAGESVLLVDADTEAPSVVQVLGLLEESAGIAAAARAAAHGRLDRAALARVCRLTSEGFRVLPGLTRADRWRELPASSLEVIWERARELAAWTVVDTAAGAEGALGGLDAAYTPRRHQATLSALEAADVVLVVGAGEPVGMHRLVVALAELAERGLPRPGAERIVLVNRVRASAAGPRPEESVREALARFADVEDAVVVPDDRAAADKALLTGATLREVSPASPARIALAELADRLSGSGTPRRRRRRAARRRGRD
ncbi:AAA family ATPase [Georgenia faecalis]|uniref:CpaE family protein n=1 Tax=Georgenia faecalis TaxID=2483799 RepID=A0ABV9DDX1_9MICO|nr:hypothetical protein [Georgenia faecalis]